MHCLSNDISCPLAQSLLTSNNSTLKINGSYNYNLMYLYYKLNILNINIYININNNIIINIVVVVVIWIDLIKNRKYKTI